LEVLANGGKPSPEDIEYIVPEFNDAEDRVYNFTRRMTFESPDFEELGLRNRRILEQIAYGKINLRRDLQRELNEALTFGREVSADKARELLARVNQLNEMIEELEQRFL
jgi:hypothetical protein